MWGSVEVSGVTVVSTTTHKSNKLSWEPFDLISFVISCEMVAEKVTHKDENMADTCKKWEIPGENWNRSLYIHFQSTFCFPL